MSFYDAGTYDSALYDDFFVGQPLVELYLNGTWVDITSYVRIAAGIRIVRGRLDEQSQPNATTCTMTLDNRDGRFSPRNASGAYYGYIGRNTPIRVSAFMDDGTSSIRFWGDVAEWPVSWSPSGAEVTTQITAAGLRRRLQQLATPLQSAYKAAMLTTAAGVQGYWPMEDGPQTTQFASALAGGSLSTVIAGITPAADADTFVASAPLPTITDGGLVQMFVPTYTSPGAITVRAFLKVSGASGGLICQINTNGAHYFLVEFNPATNQIALSMYNKATGVSEYARTPITWTFGGHNDILDGCRFSIELSQNGTGIENNIVTYTPGNISGLSAGIDTIPSATLGACTDVSWIADSTGMTATIGHTSVQATTRAAIPSIYDLGSSVIAGYAGETAGTRAARLTTAQGVAFVAVNGNVASAQMGPQPMVTFLQAFDECVAVEGGISSEDVVTRALWFRKRSSMYSAASGLTLDYTTGTDVEDLTPVDDDQQLVNDVTVVRTNGGSSRLTDTTSVVSTSAVGAYAQEFDLNLYADSQTLDQAAWRLQLGTVNKPRLGLLMWDAYLLTSTQRSNVVSLREGDRVTLTNLPAFTGLAATTDVRLLGWSETLGYRSWTFEANAVDVGPFGTVLILDDATYGILDTDRLGL